MLFNILFTVIVGSLLHFTFNFAHQAKIVGLFSAVNESSWEHLKLAVMPMALIALWWAINGKRRPNNFWLSRAVAMYLAPILILLIFYDYTAILGKNYLPLDISTFILAVILAELVARWITKKPEFSRRYNPIFQAAIILLVAIFIVFTFYPPQNILFLDPITLTYGLK
ncbi:MAG: DUF6512 family protein [Patescibacteria group bacterium]|nr:DUF6512 family protein [Patescibacteria group bacterium]MDD5121565.1 DUF6512 family protein [Patescibacteria group bacterium]MDD5222239.1 DUF6512 family protein [Patescibacteria group bacterium]MDD5396271.1 DUF6512 family protein [Patescibacteria group bacterium]